jgi:YggT family protein
MLLYLYDNVKGDNKGLSRGFCKKMAIVINLLLLALNIYFAIIIAWVVSSWLVVFGVLNMRNKWIYKGVTLLTQATEPVMSRLRRYVPPIGGIDLTPMIVIFGIILLQNGLTQLLNGY